MLGYLATVTYKGPLGVEVTQNAFADSAPHAVQMLNSFTGVVNVYQAYRDSIGTISHDRYNLVHSFARFDEVVDFINRATA